MQTITHQGVKFCHAVNTTILYGVLLLSCATVHVDEPSEEQMSLASKLKPGKLPLLVAGASTSGEDYTQSVLITFSEGEILKISGASI